MDINKTVIFSFEGELTDYIESCERDPLWSIIRKHIPPRARILEAGAGSGKWLAFLHERGYNVSGIELNAKSVERFRLAFPGIEYVAGDICSLPFPDEHFDAVLSLGVMEHFVDGPDAAMREMVRVLKREGVAVISVPCANAAWRIEKLRDKFVYKILANQSIRRVFGKAPRTYSDVDQQVYFDVMNKRIDPRAQYKLHFEPSTGITFYEYRYTVEEYPGWLKKYGFVLLCAYVEYPEDRLYHILGKLVGRYSVRNGVTLNPLGSFLRRLIPERHIGHMIIGIATKAV